MLISWLATQLEENKPKGAIASLDGVRAVACLMVIAFHIDLITYNAHLWTMSGQPLTSAILLAGDAGVTLFFVLSGFLLFLPYAKALLFEQSWPGARLFYLRRALRVMPGYYFSLVLLVLLSQPQYLQPQHWNDTLLFVLFQMDASRSTFRQINGPYWSLAIEFQFYLLLPLIALGMYAVTRLLTRWMSAEKRFWVVAACLLGVIGWGLLSRSLGEYLMEHPQTTFLVPRGTLNVILFFTYGTIGKYLEDFAVGMLASLIYVFVTGPSRAINAPRMRRLSPWLWGCGILLLLFMTMQDYSLSYDYFWPGVPGFVQLPDWTREIGFSLGFGCCILAVLFDGAALRRFFEWTPLRWIGLISYSLYIWHLPLLLVFINNVGPSLSGLPPFLIYSLYWVWVAVIIIPFSCALYLLIEKPGMRLSNRLRSRLTEKRKPTPTPANPLPTASDRLEEAPTLTR